MDTKLRPRHLLRRILATFTIICILATVTNPLVPAQIAKAEENRIILEKSPNRKYQNPLDVIYAGVLNDFNLNSTEYINVHDTFGCDFTLPVSAFTRSDPTSFLESSFDIFMIPASESISFENIIQIYTDSDINKLIPITWNQQKQGFDNDKNGFRCESDNLTFEEFLGLPASGYYRLIAFVYEENPYFMSKNNPQDPIPTILTVSRKAFAFTNPADGGDPGEAPYEDPYDGAYNTVNVSCYADGEKLNNTFVTVFSSDGQVSFGMAPCAVPVGIEVALDLYPIGEDSFLTEEYYFPRLKKGDPIITTVPANGEIVIDLEKIGIGAVVSGHVTDETGTPVANAYVSASRQDAFGYTTGIYTDDNGFYKLEGLYSTGYMINASKDNYVATSTNISHYDMSRSEVNADFVLKEKQLAFSLKFTGNINEDLYNILLPELLQNSLYVNDNVSGDFTWSSIDTVSFVPDTEKDQRNEYTIVFDTDYVLEDSVRASSGATVEVPLANLAGIRGSATYKTGQYGHPRVILFDENGHPKYDFQSENDTYAFIAVLPEGENTKTYKAISYGAPYYSTFMDLNYDMLIDTYGSRVLKNSLTLESGKVTYMGTSELDVFDLNASSISILSSAGVSGTAQTSGDLLKVTGHIEDVEPFKLKALRIYGYNQEAGDQVYAAYKTNSLVINGHVVDTASEEKLNWTELAKVIRFNEDITGPFDFSCYLTVLDITEMKVRVAVDIEINGEVREDITVGEYAANVFPVTLKTMRRTCTGEIKCSGHAPKNAQVKIWEGERLLTIVESDSQGKYEAMVRLPTNDKDYSFHSIRATSEGHSTDEVIVYYDKETTAVENIALEGGRTSGVWTTKSDFGFEALVSNPEMMSDEGEFNILCSNGTMVAVPVASEDILKPYGEINRSLLKSTTYPFGEKKLVPVKVWFVYSSLKRGASEEASVRFQSEDKSVYAGSTQGAMDTVGEIIKAPAVNVTYDVVNGLAADLIRTYSKYPKLGDALDIIGIGDMVEVYNQVSEKIDVSKKQAMIEDDQKMLSFMNQVASNLPKDVDTGRYKNTAGVAREEGYQATQMMDEYRRQSFNLGIANTIVGKIPPELPELKAIGVALQGIISPAMDEIKAHNDQAWSFYNESMTDARRRFQLMTGLSIPELAKLQEQYKAGELTDYDLRRILEERLNNKDKDAESDDSEDIKMAIDPSGFVYEAVASNRIENAVVTLYSEGMDYWEAEAYDQINPLFSDAEGKYAWDVPEGNWFVKVFKQGYEEGSSADDPAAVVNIAGVNYLPVLPPQLDVNIPLLSLSKPVASIEKIENDLCLVFSKYVSVDTVTAENVKLSDLSSSEYTLTALDAEISPAHTPVCGGKNLGRTFKIEFKNGNVPDALTAEITAAVMGYNNVSASGKASYEKNNGNTESGQPDPNDTTEPGDTIQVNDQMITLEEEKKSNAGVVVGIIIGVIVLLGGAAAFVILKKRKENE